MISGVAFCPHPPALVPAVAQGAAPELDGLRAACRTAIERVVRGGERIVVLGSGATTAHHEATARGTLAGHGVPLEVALGAEATGPAELPLSLTIGAWLLREYAGPGTGATGWSVADDGAQVELPDDAEPTALLVMGDGSARRSTAAPGYLDPRAEQFDAALARALAAGDADAIGLGDDELLVAGGPAWRAASRALSGTRWDAELLYADAPYGVGYFVAVWTR